MIDTLLQLAASYITEGIPCRLLGRRRDGSTYMQQEEENYKRWLTDQSEGARNASPDKMLRCRCPPEICVWSASSRRLDDGSMYLAVDEFWHVVAPRVSHVDFSCHAEIHVECINSWRRELQTLATAWHRSSLRPSLQQKTHAFAHLHTLNLSSCALDDASVTALCSMVLTVAEISPYPPALKQVHFASNAIGDSGCQAICDTVLRLQSLQQSRVGEAATVLCPFMEVLNLAGNCLSLASVASFAALATCSSLAVPVETLIVADNPCTSGPCMDSLRDTWYAFGLSLGGSWGCSRRLSLSGCDLTMGDGALGQFLCGVVDGYHDVLLPFLSEKVDTNCIGGECAAEAVPPALQASPFGYGSTTQMMSPMQCLTCLDLSFQGLGDAGVAALATAIQSFHRAGQNIMDTVPAYQCRGGDDAHKQFFYHPLLMLEKLTLRKVSCGAVGLRALATLVGPQHLFCIDGQLQQHQPSQQHPQQDGQGWGPASAGAALPAVAEKCCGFTDELADYLVLLTEHPDEDEDNYVGQSKRTASQLLLCRREISVHVTKGRSMLPFLNTLDVSDNAFGRAEEDAGELIASALLRRRHRVRNTKDAAARGDHEKPFTLIMERCGLVNTALVSATATLLTALSTDYTHCRPCRCCRLQGLSLRIGHNRLTFSGVELLRSACDHLTQLCLASPPLPGASNLEPTRFVAFVEGNRVAAAATTSCVAAAGEEEGSDEGHVSWDDVVPFGGGDDVRMTWGDMQRAYRTQDRKWGSPTPQAQGHVGDAKHSPFISLGGGGTITNDALDGIVADADSVMRDRAAYGGAGALH